MPEISTETIVSGAEAATAPEGTGEAEASNTLSEVELARKRQAGAEKARQEADRQLAETRAELDRLRAGTKPGENSQVDIDAAIKQAKAELKAEYEANFAKAKAEAEGAALDARFPSARTRFPEVTDAVKLAELEGLFGETAEPPKPVGNNQQKTVTGAPDIETMTSKQLQEYMKTLSAEEAGIFRS